VAPVQNIITNYSLSSYVRSQLLPRSATSRHSHRQPVLKHLRHVIPSDGRPGFTPVQKNRSSHNLIKYSPTTIPQGNSYYATFCGRKMKHKLANRHHRQIMVVGCWDIKHQIVHAQEWEQENNTRLRFSGRFTMLASYSTNLTVRCKTLICYAQTLQTWRDGIVALSLVQYINLASDNVQNPGFI
jgi:hypothetical protein